MGQVYERLVRPCRRQLEHACRTALSGRPGPVFIELPIDVLMNVADNPQIPDRVMIEPIEPEPGLVKKMFDMLQWS